LDKRLRGGFLLIQEAPVRLSTLFGRTLREAPADADSEAYQLVLRAGLARPLLAGGYALLPLGVRVARRIETIMHDELARIGGQELRTPIVQASAAWEQTGRYDTYGPLMLRLTDRGERRLIVAPTHEEAIAELARREVASYRQLPALVYQIHTKYRDEIRTRGGLMRMREFTMLDAYSLDTDAGGLDQVYTRIAGAFERIFARCGVRYIAVEAGGGEMGGREAREYMAISPSGEDTLVICPGCGYAANYEVAVARSQKPEAREQFKPRRARRARRGRILKSTSTLRDLRGKKMFFLRSGAPAARYLPPADEVATPHCTTIAELAAFLGVPESATAKAVFFNTKRGLLFAVIRGDLEVNEHKLRAAARVGQLEPASSEQIMAAGALPGYASPVGLPLTTTGQRPRTNETNADEAFSEHPSSGVYVLADPSVVDAGPLVAGANREGFHLRNVVYGRDWRATLVADIAAARVGDPCARCGAPLVHERGVEIGHIFKLGTRYTEALGAGYLDQAGVTRPVVMGSYGIGIERLLQIIVEQHHDAAGITWPVVIAPLDAHLIALGKSVPAREAAEALEEELEAAGVHVLYDDREETAGVKFNDADLIGLPLRVVISDRLLATGQIELKPRIGGEPVRVARADAVAAVRAALQ
jgi:prolyl-tRNA synthetase